MQWYLASLAMLLVMVGAGVLLGALVLAPLPARMQPGARIFLSVPLGWALLTLVATLPGWIGHGYANCHCTVMTALLAAAGAWTGRHWLRHAGGDCLRLAAFCVVASFPVLDPLLRQGIFSLYNDTFIYVCQAQWLQHHGFLAHAHTTNGQAAWAQVVCFQSAHLRMGASFLLGWTQAIFGQEWALDVYPTAAAMGLICGALGVGATVLAVCPGRWPEAWLAALAAAATMNGFLFGATEGFLPQTWGLAFASTAFGLRALETGTHAERSGRAAWRTGVPLGICLAASMHCYWDLLPLEAPALALTYLLPWPGWRNVWRRAWVPAVTCVALVNLEWIRAAQGILMNLKAVVANPVDWPAWHFPAHAVGLVSSAWDGGRWMSEGLPPGFALAGCVAAVVWLAVLAASQTPTRWRHWLRPPSRLARWHGRALIPALTWVGMSTLLFLYFRYAVPSPWRVQNATGWPDGTGQSWSQYKLVTWASLGMITLVGAGLAGMALHARSLLLRVLVIMILTVWCGTGLGWQYKMAQWEGKWALVDAGTHRNPLTALLAIRQMVAPLPPGDWIYLDWPPGERVKYREWAVYFLNGHPLASDWSDDGYIWPHMTPADLQRTAADCAWVLRYRPPDPSPPLDGAVPALGGMTLERRQP